MQTLLELSGLTSLRLSCFVPGDGGNFPESIVHCMAAKVVGNRKCLVRCY